ncbi:hypothetical protein ABIA33_007573 [Streptacidiphilus sp. MAP12-16]|uniref:hypothetical protein n=1 Tax=Streptacidiphilus sp. MAP12-16 TaxID=3156300 RepID=UPI003511B4D8
MNLVDLADLTASGRNNETSFEAFRASPMITSLQWPDDVVEQFLYDHGNYPPFLLDYGRVDLSRVRWDVEVIPANDFSEMPTGESEADCIEEFAAHPEHYVEARSSGIHIGVAECWERQGTWKRWPILIDRRLLDPPGNGLQVVEGRTRVGVLRGRRRQGDFVADQHRAWVGRAAT